MISDQGLLFIEPVQSASPTPVIDPITRKMCAAFRQATDSNYAYGGWHSCICGATSSCTDYHLPNGDLTNSLCVHYVAHHRSEVPHRQLARMDAFTFGEMEPTWRELHGPHPIFPAFPEEVRRAVNEVEAQIEALHADFMAAVAKQDWEEAARLRVQTRNQTNAIEEELQGKKENIIREWRNRYLVEHFDSITDPWIKMRWGVCLVDAEGAAPQILRFLRAALDSTEQFQILSDRLGTEFDDFLARLNACESTAASH